MATRNSSEVERRRLRVLRNRSPAHSRMETSHTATESSVARPASQRSPSRRRSSTLAPPPKLPSPIRNAIDEQRGQLATAMTLLHCLHCVLRREAHDTGPNESAEFEDAIGWVDLPNVTAMILVRLHAIHLALDSVSLRHALEVSES
jgi:hypothetical protein